MADKGFFLVIKKDVLKLDLLAYDVALRQVATSCHHLLKVCVVLLILNLCIPKSTVCNSRTAKLDLNTVLEQVN